MIHNGERHEYTGTRQGFKEFQHCIRSGMSKATANACAAGVERVMAARGPNKVFVPRVRCKFFNRGA